MTSFWRIVTAVVVCFLTSPVRVRVTAYQNDYVDLGTRFLEVHGSQCSSYAFKVPVGHYHILIKPSFPASCSQNQTLRVSHRLFTKNECLAIYANGSCKKSLRHTDDLCDMWDVVGVNMTQDALPVTYDGTQCWQVEYYLSLGSSCRESFNAALEMKIMDLSEVRNEACKGYETTKELYTLTIVLIVLLPLMFVILLSVAWYCFYCSWCPIHKLIHEARKPIVYRSTASSDRLLPRPSQLAQIS